MANLCVHNCLGTICRDLETILAALHPRLQARTKPAQRIEAEADRKDDRRQGDRQHEQQWQTEAHLDLRRDRCAMGQRLRHGDPNRVLKGASL